MSGTSDLVAVENNPFLTVRFHASVDITDPQSSVSKKASKVLVWNSDHCTYQIPELDNNKFTVDWNIRSLKKGVKPTDFMKISVYTEEPDCVPGFQTFVGADKISLHAMYDYLSKLQQGSVSSFSIDLADNFSPVFATLHIEPMSGENYMIHAAQLNNHLKTKSFRKSVFHDEISPGKILKYANSVRERAIKDLVIKPNHGCNMFLRPLSFYILKDVPVLYSDLAGLKPDACPLPSCLALLCCQSSCHYNHVYPADVAATIPIFREILDCFGCKYNSSKIDSREMLHICYDMISALFTNQKEFKYSTDYHCGHRALETFCGSFKEPNGGVDDCDGMANSEKMILSKFKEWSIETHPFMENLLKFVKSLKASSSSNKHIGGNVVNTKFMKANVMNQINNIFDSNVLTKDTPESLRLPYLLMANTLTHNMVSKRLGWQEILICSSAPAVGSQERHLGGHALGSIAMFDNRPLDTYNKQDIENMEFHYSQDTHGKPIEWLPLEGTAYCQFIGSDKGQRSVPVHVRTKDDKDALVKVPMSTFLQWLEVNCLKMEHVDGMETRVEHIMSKCDTHFQDFYNRVFIAGKSMLGVRRSMQDMLSGLEDSPQTKMRLGKLSSDGKPLVEFGVGSAYDFTQGDVVELTLSGKGMEKTEWENIRTYAEGCISEAFPPPNDRGVDRILKTWSGMSKEVPEFSPLKRSEYVVLSSMAAVASSTTTVVENAREQRDVLLKKTQAKARCFNEDMKSKGLHHRMEAFASMESIILNMAVHINSLSVSK